jgi:serine/threonine-protein kinase
MDSLTLPAERVIGSGTNGYRIQAELGRGASGIVYKAHRLDRPEEIVAIKLIAGFGSLDSQLVEPEILTRLKHPNIISLIDYFLAAGKLALVTEYIDGPDLSGFVKDHGRLSSVEVHTFLKQMAGALKVAHLQGIIHRDLKPSNILVTRDLAGGIRYVLADFGISRQVEGLQSTKQLAGSYRFMAPEQLLGRATLDSDLWSLGVVAYWLLTGTMPFKGESLEELSRQIAYGPPAAPSVLVSGVDHRLETLILKLLTKDPTQRVESAEFLLRELQTELVAAPPLPSGAARSTPTWEAEINESIRRRRRLFFIFFVMWTVPELIVGQLLIAVGAYFVYLQQVRRGEPVHIAIGGLMAMVMGLLIQLRINVYKIVFMAWVMGTAHVAPNDVGRNEKPSVPGSNIERPLFGDRLRGTESRSRGNDLESLQVGDFYVTSLLILPVSLLCVYNFGRWKRLERERFLLRSLRTQGDDDRALIKILAEYLEQNPEDMIVRQQLAQIHFVRGHYRWAVIEAKLVLSIDAYNFPASLLLAQSYLELGLREEAVLVCDAYLSVSPQSFEFRELRQRCLEPGRGKAAEK